MDFSVDGFPGKLIDLGAVGTFKARITRLNKRIKGRSYKLRELVESDEGSFWLFEAEDDDEILGGVLKMKKGRFYAISEDVLSLLDSEFARKS